MSSYNKTRFQGNNEDYYRVAQARIEKIRTQLANSPRGSKLKDKVCIVTGVGSLKGIGRASAIRFAHEGARHLYLVDFIPDNLPDLESTINKLYPDVRLTTVQADAADENAISEICTRALREEGRLDVFFANAGVASRNALADTSAETFMNSMRINALSCFLAVKYASEAMKKTDPSKGKETTGGSIIMTASVAGLRSGAGTVDYSASKAAVNSMAKTCAYQLQRTDIRVNSICPGLIETGMTDDTFEYARQRGTQSKIGQLNPLGRYAVAEEIAQAAVFLASGSVPLADFFSFLAVYAARIDDSSYVNGQNFAVDGGLSSSHPVVPGRWV